MFTNKCAKDFASCANFDVVTCGLNAFFGAGKKKVRWKQVERCPIRRPLQSSKISHAIRTLEERSASFCGVLLGPLEMSQ